MTEEIAENEPKVWLSQKPAEHVLRVLVQKFQGGKLLRCSQCGKPFKPNAKVVTVTRDLSWTEPQRFHARCFRRPRASQQPGH